MSLDATLLGKFLNNDKRACAKIISIVENRQKGYEEYLEFLKDYTVNTYIIGITGAPGVGKSTLINCLSNYYLNNNINLAVIAIDPSSPFSGGAILGDRIRLSNIQPNKNFFFRSLSSRGSLGGLSEAIDDIILVLSAFKKEIILVETVGTGQNEVDVMHCCDTVIIVVMPKSGDDIQTIKAGLFEIGNIFVINKIDVDGYEQTLHELQSMLMLNKINSSYEIPIILTNSKLNQGIDKLAQAINTHYQHLISNKQLEINKSNRYIRIFNNLLKKHLLLELEKKIEAIKEYNEIKDNVKNNLISPYKAYNKAFEIINQKIFK